MNDLLSPFVVVYWNWGISLMIPTSSWSMVVFDGNISHGNMIW
jgi:hypothetical protein